MQIDRRVMKTRTALYDALVALVLRQDYESISVQDILDEADIGRSTFYAHFTSKDDLLARSLERLRALLVEASAADAGRTEGKWSLVLFTHVAEYKDVYYALAGVRAGQVLSEAIYAIVAEFSRPLVQPGKTVPRELATRHVGATFMTIMTWWLDRKRSLTPAEVDVLFRELLNAGVAVS